jgi:cell division septation protein DedD
MAQDDYYYEIQLTNKQLVFYFMAGATGLILSFLAGVMVGRGVDSGGADVQASRPVVEERVVAEEAAKAAPPAAADLTYAQRLESEKADEGLERPKAASAGKNAPAPAAKAPEKTPTRTAAAAPPPVVPKAGSGPAAQPPASRAIPPVAESKAAVKTAPPPVAAPVPDPASSSASKGFTVQVGAFKDKATADSVVTRLKGKGFAAYVMSPGATEGGLFVVRVGSYPQRTDAERVEAKLRDQEKFRPYIVKN